MKILPALYTGKPGLAMGQRQSETSVKIQAGEEREGGTRHHPERGPGRGLGAAEEPFPRRIPVNARTACYGKCLSNTSTGLQSKTIYCGHRTPDSILQPKNPKLLEIPDEASKFWHITVGHRLGSCACYGHLCRPGTGKAELSPMARLLCTWCLHKGWALLQMATRPIWLAAPNNTLMSHWGSGRRKLRTDSIAAQ